MKDSVPYNSCIIPLAHSILLSDDPNNIAWVVHVSDFGGLGVACWPLVPKSACSNPAEAVGFLRAKKSSARLPSEGK